MNLKYQLKMFVQNMTQVKSRSPAVTQRLLENDLTRLNGLTILTLECQRHSETGHLKERVFNGKDYSFSFCPNHSKTNLLAGLDYITYNKKCYI